MAFNNTKLKSLLLTFLFTAGILINSAALAAKPDIIIFYADWSVKSRTVRTQVKSIAKELNLDVLELNVDKRKTHNKAIDMGINIPSKVPYIYIVIDKGKTVKASSPSQIKNDLLKLDST